MSLSTPDRGPQFRKRRLRLEMGRVRRRIDRRVRASRRRAGELVSWRTYARRYPGNMLLGAFGLGLALSAGLGGRRFARSLGLRLFRLAWRQGLKQLGRELPELWSKTAPARPHGEAANTPAGHDARR